MLLLGGIFCDTHEILSFYFKFAEHLFSSAKFFPLDRGTIKSLDVESDEELTLEPKDDSPLAALAFKVVTDPYVGRLISVCAGTPGKTNTVAFPSNINPGVVPKGLRITVAPLGRWFVFSFSFSRHRKFFFAPVVSTS